MTYRDTNLKDINTSKTHEEIKIKELPCGEINYSEKHSVEKLRKKLIYESVKIFIICLLISIMIVFVFYTALVNSKDLALKEIIFVPLLAVAFLGAGLYSLKDIILIKKRDYQYASYGTIKNKYYMNSSSSSTSRKNYFVNVNFSNNTFLKGIICNKDTYELLEHNNDVLVVSFNGNNAYAIPVENFSR